MKNIDSYLDYVESVAHNFLDAKSRAPICSEIESIRQKNADPYLYLAVVGEFSSGKSTFINALAGERLLKDAVMPTTASATYIRRRGDVRAIEVQFNSGRRMRATENDWNALSTYLSRMCGVRSSSFRELIHALTSDSKAAVHVARLDIDLPEAPLPPNIVVIDTPGFNPGNDNGGDHLGITSRVVGQVADLAIILTPQEQAMSASLSAFVAEKLGRFLHRCTFVVTKIDNQYIPQQRADTLLYVRGRIAADLGLDDAPLYALSSVAVLPGIMVPPGREDEFKALRADFAAFRSQTWKRIEQKHHIVLAEHVLALLDRTLAGCKESLANRRKELEKERKFLREHQIESVAVVTRSMAKKAVDDINRRLSEINRFDAAFDAAAARAISKATEIINSRSAMSAQIFDSIVPDIDSAVDTEVSKVLHDISYSINSRLKQYVQERINEMSAGFSLHYQGFEGLRNTTPVPKANVMSLRASTLDAFDAKAAIKHYEEEEKGAALIGAGGGLLAGLAFLSGPVGWGVAAVAGLVGGMMVGDKSEEMKKAAVTALSSEIRKKFNYVRKRASQAIKSIAFEHEKLVSGFANDHVERYGQDVDRQIEQRKIRLDQIDAGISALSVANSKLSDISRNISSHLEKLKSI